METILAMPAQPLRGAPMPPAAIKVRLKTSPLLRRLLPTPLVLARTARRAQRAWEQSPQTRAEAAAAMEIIVAGTARAGDVELLGRAHVIAAALAEAHTWQPWPIPHIDPVEAERVCELFSSDRGVLLSSCHLDRFFLSVPGIASLGVVPFTVAGPWFFQEPSHDRWGRRLAVWQKRCRSRMILSQGSFPTLRALLARGDAVFLFFDMPGPRARRASSASRRCSPTGPPALPSSPTPWCFRCAPARAGLMCRSISGRCSIRAGSPRRESCTTRSQHSTSNGFSSPPRRWKTRVSSAGARERHLCDGHPHRRPTTSAGRGRSPSRDEPGGRPPAMALSPQMRVMFFNEGNLGTHILGQGRLDEALRAGLEGLPRDRDALFRAHATGSL